LGTNTRKITDLGSHLHN